VRVVAATTFVIYAHDDASRAPVAAEHVCRENRVAPLDERGCRPLAIARLAADGASVEQAYELGLWCDGATAEIEIGDFDDDDRDEMSVRVPDRAFVVIDLATFDVQFASGRSTYAIEHPEGTGLYDTCYRPAGEHHLDVGVDHGEYAFEDDLGAPSRLVRQEGEALRSDCENFRMRYDPAGDCWRMPPPT
jgi:hypothetical protein